jgi:hypothetical protein
MHAAGFLGADTNLAACAGQDWRRRCVQLRATCCRFFVGLFRELQRDLRINPAM